MNKIDKETSLQLLKLERENSKEAPEIIQKLLNSVEKAVEADKISYFDFIEDMMKGWKKYQMKMILHQRREKKQLTISVKS